MRRPFSNVARWPLAFRQPPAERRRALLAGVVLGAVLIACGLAARVTDALGAWPCTLITALGAMVMSASLVLRHKRQRHATSAHVEAGSEGLTLVMDEGRKSLIASWDSPFGVLLLASYGRPVALLALTTPTQTRFVPTRVDGRSDADDALLARIAVLADLDLIDGVANDAALSPIDAAALVRHLAERSDGALGRVFSSDGRRALVSIERAALQIGARAFDLTRPVEWRPLMFHEATGQAAPLYQATWIRQEGAEVVLVAPMPASILPRDATAKSATGKLGQVLTRDLALLQSHVEAPPPRDVRVAIDRPLMLAIRRALADAPLGVRVSPAPGTRLGAERSGPFA